MTNTSEIEQKWKDKICPLGVYCKVCRSSQSGRLVHLNSVAKSNGIVVPKQVENGKCISQINLDKYQISINKTNQKKVLTIGMAVYDDYNGMYFTCQSIKLHHAQIMHKVNIIIIDNNPTSQDGSLTKQYCNNMGFKYIEYTEKMSTSVRQQIFVNAQTQFVMCVDSHVLIQSGAINKLINYFESKYNPLELLQGPLVSDCGKVSSTNMKPQWRDNFFGVWESNSKNIKEGQPFQIDMHGLGLFACSKNSWLGFNENFNGFGGEQGYIHQKFKNIGGKTLCLPFLKWTHRHKKSGGTKYKNSLRDRFKNYIFGRLQNGLQIDDVINAFSKDGPKDIKTINKPFIQIQTMNKLVQQCKTAHNNNQTKIIQFINIKSKLDIKENQISKILENFTIVINRFDTNIKRNGDMIFLSKFQKKNNLIQFDIYNLKRDIKVKCSIKSNDIFDLSKGISKINIDFNSKKIDNFQIIYGEIVQKQINIYDKKDSSYFNKSENKTQVSSTCGCSRKNK